MATFILLSELLVTEVWDLTQRDDLISRLVQVSKECSCNTPHFSMPHLKVYESKVSFCGWPACSLWAEIRYICYWIVFRVWAIVRSPLQSPRCESHIYEQSDPYGMSLWWGEEGICLLMTISGLLPIWNLVRLGKVGIMLLRKWQVYVKQISRYRFRRSNSDLIINRHRGHRAI